MTGRSLKRNRQQRVDQTAVEDHDLFGKRRGIAVEHNAVAIAAGREQRGLAGVHDARNHETGARLEFAIVGGDARRAQHVTVTLRLVDVGLA